MIIVTACSRAETVWIPRLAGLRTVRTPMGEKAAGALNRVLDKIETLELIVSTGFCGGLLPRLRPGGIVLAETIHHHGETLEIDPALLDRARTGLCQAGVDFTVGTIRASDRVVQSPDEKRRLQEEGAIAVDMESGPVARLAHAKGIGFLSLKAVLDPADHVLPFTTGRSLICSILAHPLAALRFSWLSFVAGRAIGRAVLAVASAFDGREG